MIILNICPSGKKNAFPFWDFGNAFKTEKKIMDFENAFLIFGNAFQRILEMDFQFLEMA
jgi:hypothetical protein